jgi:hypothetical protein
LLHRLLAPSGRYLTPGRRGVLFYAQHTRENESPPLKPADPCEPSTFSQAACETAVTNRGYYHNGTWFPHVYAYGAMYYLTRHNSYVAGGGRVRTMSPTVYSPRVATPSRPNVVRGGFGGIGAGHGAAGS